MTPTEQAAFEKWHDQFKHEGYGICASEEDCEEVAAWGIAYERARAAGVLARFYERGIAHERKRAAEVAERLARESTLGGDFDWYSRYAAIAAEIEKGPEQRCGLHTFVTTRECGCKT